MHQPSPAFGPNNCAARTACRDCTATHTQPGGASGIPSGASNSERCAGSFCSTCQTAEIKPRAAIAQMPQKVIGFTVMASIVDAAERSAPSQTDAASLAAPASSGWGRTPLYAVAWTEKGQEHVLTFSGANGALRQKHFQMQRGHLATITGPHWSKQ